jgi:hypothetical protein
LATLADRLGDEATTVLLRFKRTGGGNPLEVTPSRLV